jgi:hypothetical protein
LIEQRRYKYSTTIQFEVHFLFTSKSTIEQIGRIPDTTTRGGGGRRRSEINRCLGQDLVGDRSDFEKFVMVDLPSAPLSLDGIAILPDHVHGARGRRKEGEGIQREEGTDWNEIRFNWTSYESLVFRNCFQEFNIGTRSNHLIPSQSLLK